MKYERKWWAAAAAFAGTFSTVLILGQVNAMLPTLVDYFGADVASIQWVVLAYSVTLAGLLLASGRLADVVGRRRIYSIGFVGYGVGSVLCAVSPSLPWLVGARIVQGVFGAMVIANTMALLTQSFPPEQRGLALGFSSTVVASAQLLAPSVAGYLIQHVGWQANFWLQAALALVGVLLARFALGELPRKPDSFDLPGALLFALTIVAMTLALNQGPRLGWWSPLVLGLLAAGLALGAAYAWLSRRTASPVFDLRLLANRRFAFSNACVFLTWLGLQATGFVLPFFLQRVVGLSPAEMGVLLMAQPAVIFVLSPLGGWLADRWGCRLPGTVGALCDVAAVLFLATATPATGRAGLILRLALTGVGGGLAQTANNSAVLGEVSGERAGTASGFVGTMRHLGMLTGTALIGTTFSAHSAAYAAQAGGNLAVGYYRGFREALLLLAGVHLLSATVSALRGPHREACADEVTPIRPR